MNIICENGIYLDDGVYHSLKCKITNDNCTFVRWCVVDSCLKMTPLYEECKYRGEQMSKNKKVIEIDKFVNDTQSLKIEVCKVLWVRNSKIAVDFKGYGITIEGTTDKEYLEVEYESEIGKSDFKVNDYK